MDLKVIPVPAFEDNYIWAIDNGNYAAIVDPGDSRPVFDYLAKNSLTLSAILLTHHHSDHIDGVGDLLRQMPVPVYGPSDEYILWVDHPLAHGEYFVLEHLAIELLVMHVPGHTVGHIAYWFEGDAMSRPRLFCGDTLFSCGCGRLFESAASQKMLYSLDRLAALPGETYVHCSHEYTMSNILFALTCDPRNVALKTWQGRAQYLRDQRSPTLPTTLAQERVTNPFLRSDAPEIVASAQYWAGKLLHSREEVFATIRAWKDVF
ncbi:hydroxyacylglutathione hydrolase [Candidatus Pandoraea novymonadis]|uniref:Hydroxyacylglutathione hydrolase n=1 Tax=Candidatus Pandoraea novymonadis TaxID=1808959 RepID=A0ABX5FET1_9BURK|nr:hydroxyacylglutathione hydrolase [Candidatus Pandoraea novymonadis]PSB92190.1 Hydroxyacylglutathione hydrolase [Candidatus Pandoraea novymonadis]